MSQNEKLKILVTQRYSWDTFWYEELLNKTKKELQESSKKEKILQKHIYNSKYFVYNIWR